MALEVIGAGLGRTGTMSLKLALEHLGLGPCHHMTEVLSDAPRHLPLWLDVVRGKPDWEAVFAGYASAVDYPAAAYWRELAAFFSEARVILSTRDAEAWFTSVNKTIMNPENIARIGEGPMAEFMKGTVLREFGDRVADRGFMVETFRRHEAEVIATLPPERLLVHRAADGWEPLCAFLGVPVPAEPYPSVNSSEDMLAARVADADRHQDGKGNFARDYIAAMKAKAFG